MEQRFKEKFGGVLPVLLREFIAILKARNINVINDLIFDLGMAYLQNCDPVTAMKSFISTSYLHWPELKQNDDDESVYFTRVRQYFTENIASIFGKNQMILNVAKDLTPYYTMKDDERNYIVSDDYVGALLDLCKDLIRISIGWIHEKMMPVIDEDCDPNEAYAMHYEDTDPQCNSNVLLALLDSEDFKEVAKTWSVKLEW